MQARIARRRPAPPGCADRGQWWPGAVAAQVSAEAANVDAGKRQLLAGARGPGDEARAGVKACSLERRSRNSKSRDEQPGTQSDAPPLLKVTDQRGTPPATKVPITQTLYVAACPVTRSV